MNQIKPISVKADNEIKSKTTGKINKKTSITVRIDDVERKKLDAMSAESGLTASEIVRKIINGQEIKPFKKLQDIVKNVSDIDMKVNELLHLSSDGIVKEAVNCRQKLNKEKKCLLKYLQK